MESQLRSLVKTVTFRIVAVLGTIALIWTITGNIEESTEITIAVHVLLTVLYFANERVWNKIDWGRTRRL